MVSVKLDTLTILLSFYDTVILVSREKFTYVFTTGSLDQEKMTLQWSFRTFMFKLTSSFVICFFY